MELIKLSVGKMVEYLLRCGSIDSGHNSQSSMQDGIKAHKKIQKMTEKQCVSQGGSYQKEVSLSLLLSKNEYELMLIGRADGIIEQDGGILIDEIKSTTRPFETVDGRNTLHWAQAKCYAYMYASTLSEAPKSIEVQLTYYQIDTQEIKRYKEEYLFSELKEFVYALADKYNDILLYERDHRQKRKESLLSLSFPFKNYRDGQYKLAASVYKSVVDKKHLFVCAPTGIGKTISTVFPSLKAMGEGHIDKLFYLTSKTITRQAAQEAFRLLQNSSESFWFKYITLTAKDKICFCDERVCTPEACKYANGHFDRVNDAIWDVLKNNDTLTREIIEAYAEKHTVCPYELSLDLSLWADALICDYNYAFDPVVYLRRFFGDDTEEQKYTFLIDEAHNLPDRARDMYSASLSKSQVYSVLKLISNKKTKLYKALKELNSYFVALKKTYTQSGMAAESEKPEQAAKLTAEICKYCEEWLKENEGHAAHNSLLELYFDCLFFIKIFEEYDKRYITFYEKSSNDISLMLFCIDPSFLLSRCYKKACSVIFFSATLVPLSFYRDILGGSETSRALMLESPFKKENLTLIIENKISTKYRFRDESVSTITKKIYEQISIKKGNYIVYFPSFAYMKQVYEDFSFKHSDVNILAQRTSMTEKEREEFLQAFDIEGKDTLVGFCVMGGIFSEGIDLKGDRLSGAVIVGVGLPKISARQDVIKDYFNEKNGRGYEYSYMYPGMNKVLQAAGRVIRSESDKGTVLLIDSRFTTKEYLDLFPKHWADYKISE